MELPLFSDIQEFYGWNKDVQAEKIGSGLINNTFKVSAGSKQYILQRLNENVFTSPTFIDDNLTILAAYFKKNHPSYLFTAPVKGISGATLFHINDIYYRSFEYIPDTITINIVENTSQAFEAAFQFGKFTALTDELEPSSLKVTLPDFHNLLLRYDQFDHASGNGNLKRIKASKDEIKFIASQKDLLMQFEKFIQHKHVKQRITHHDTKISNVLFKEDFKGLCVIDLDTVMPGYFLSDVGDMFRTYICPVSEEEQDLDKITVRKDFIEAIQDGYLSAMEDKLTSFEKDRFLFAGEALIYMQAIRYLTDYLNDDVYYGSKYPDHNLMRAKNQIYLLQKYQEAIK